MQAVYDYHLCDWNEGDGVSQTPEQKEQGICPICSATTELIEAEKAETKTEKEVV